MIGSFALVVQVLLTICGMARNNNGIFRPNLADSDTNRKFPKREPMHSNDVTSDASNTVNFPDGNGVSSVIHSM